MENIILIIVGIIIIIIGVLNTRGNISMLHSYHRKRVSEEDRLPFGRTVGVGMFVIGISLILAGGLFFMASALQNNLPSVIGTVILLTGIVVGTGISFYAMFKYNKGIF